MGLDEVSVIRNSPAPTGEGLSNATENAGAVAS